MVMPEFVHHILPVLFLVSRYADTREQHALPISAALSYKNNNEDI